MTSGGKLEVKISNVNDIKYLVIDVDGTMTDTGIYYDNSGNEMKRFSTRDGEAVFMARLVGIKIIVLTGRTCHATERRMKELGVDFYAQGIGDKYQYLSSYLEANNIAKSSVGYIGDDVNDIKAMSLVDYVACPSDACKEVKKIANYISNVKGGYGAVRDVIEKLLIQRDEWDNALKLRYGV